MRARSSQQDAYLLKCTQEPNDPVDELRVHILVVSPDRYPSQNGEIEHLEDALPFHLRAE